MVPETKVTFIEGPKDGAVIYEQWSQNESPLCERLNRGMWWWGAAVVHNDQCFLYTEENPRDERDRKPPQELRLVYRPEANADQVDLF